MKLILNKDPSEQEMTTGHKDNGNLDLKLDQVTLTLDLEQILKVTQIRFEN